MSQWHNGLFEILKKTNEFTLLGIPYDPVKSVNPYLRRETVTVPEWQGVETVAVPVFLVAGPKASDEQVTRVLEILYANADRLEAVHLVRREKAAEAVKAWQLGLHPAARKYFQRISSPQTRPAAP